MIKIVVVLVSIQGKVKQTEGDPRPPRRPPCVDTFPMCFGWSRLGYCSSNTRERFMSEYCKRSCNLCSSINPEYISTWYYLHLCDISVLLLQYKVRVIE